MRNSSSDSRHRRRRDRCTGGGLRPREHAPLSSPPILAPVDITATVLAGSDVTLGRGYARARKSPVSATVLRRTSSIGTLAVSTFPLRLRIDFSVAHSSFVSASESSLAEKSAQKSIRSLHHAQYVSTVLANVCPYFTFKLNIVKLFYIKKPILLKGAKHARETVARLWHHKCVHKNMLSRRRR